MNEHPFLFYWLISGLIEFFWNKLVIWKLQFKPKRKEQFENRIAELAWQTGVSKKNILLLMDFIFLLMGFLTLPFHIFAKLYILFTGKNLITGEPIEKE